MWDIADIDVQKTMRLIKSGMDQENILDARKAKEQGDRLKLIHRKLPTLDKVQHYKYLRDTNCPMCHQEYETQDHLFVCPEAQRSFVTLADKTQEIMKSRLDTQDFYQSLKKQGDLPAMSYILYFLNNQRFFDSSFLGTPQAKGLISTQLTSHFTRAKRLKSNRDRWMHLAIDSWLSAFYEVIWKERCRALEKDNTNTIRITLRCPPDVRSQAPSQQDPIPQDNRRHIRSLVLRLPPPTSPRRWLNSRH